MAMKNVPAAKATKAAGGRPKVGVKKPTGKSHPMLKGNVGNKAGTAGKTVTKVPAKKVAAKKSMGAGKRTGGGIKYS
jgi:hypothetical protein